MPNIDNCVNNFFAKVDTGGRADGTPDGIITIQEFEASLKPYLTGSAKRLSPNQFGGWVKAVTNCDDADVITAKGNTDTIPVVNAVNQDALYRFLGFLDMGNYKPSITREQVTAFIKHLFEPKSDKKGEETIAPMQVGL